MHGCFTGGFLQTSSRLDTWGECPLPSLPWNLSPKETGTLTLTSQPNVAKWELGSGTVRQYIAPNQICVSALSREGYPFLTTSPELPELCCLISLSWLQSQWVSASRGWCSREEWQTCLLELSGECLLRSASPAHDLVPYTTEVPVSSPLFPPHARKANLH